MEPSGRHRFFRLAAAEVADLLEWIDAMDLPKTNPPKRPRPGTDLSYARTCYDHLGGELSVDLLSSLQRRELVAAIDGPPSLTRRGHAWFAGLGIDTDQLRRGRRPLVRMCLDWTHREHHMGGALGAALLDHILRSRWVRRGRDRRVIKVTDVGAIMLDQRLAIAMA